MRQSVTKITKIGQVDRKMRDIASLYESTNTACCACFSVKLAISYNTYACRQGRQTYRRHVKHFIINDKVLHILSKELRLAMEFSAKEAYLVIERKALRDLIKDLR